MPIIVNIAGDDSQFQAKLRQLNRFFSDQQILVEAGMEAMAMVATRFKAQGPGWAPLSTRTKLRRRGNRSKILQDTGRLRNSITAADSSADGIYQLTSDSLTIGSNLRYAAIHQFGWDKAQNPPPRIPARPYIPPADEMAARIQKRLERIQKRLERLLKRSIEGA